MSFFDKLKKQVVEVGQTTAQKTKDIAEIVKLTSDVSEEEKKIKAAYEKMGELYFNLNAEKAEGDFAPFVEAVNSSKAKLEELKKELSKLKGVKQCEVCGKEIKAEDTFCSGCGSEVKKDVEEVKEEVEQKAEEVKEKAEEVAGQVKEKAEGMADKAVDVAEQAKEKATDVFEYVKEKAEEVVSEVKNKF